MSAGPDDGVVLVVGDLLLDVAVVITGDQVPRADTESTITVRRGGSAAGVAASVAAAGGRARLVAAVGDDAAGEVVVAELAELGVEVVAERRGRTGTVVGLVHPDGDRSMLTDRGAAADLRGVPTSALAEVAAVHVPAYGLLGGGSTERVALDALRSAPPGAIRSVDVSSISLLDDGGVALDGVLAEADVGLVLANRDEASALGWPGSWLPGVSTRVVKLGPEGAQVDDVHGRRVVATDEIGGVDTTGAGDAFAGGLLAALVSGSELDDAVRYGHAAASRLLENRRTHEEHPRVADPRSPRGR